MAPRTKALAFIAVGASALVIGVLGMIWASGDGDESEQAVDDAATTTAVSATTAAATTTAAPTTTQPPTTTAAPTTTEPPTTTAAPTTTEPPTTTVAPEDPAEFVDTLIQAQADEDVDTLIARLHPEVLDRYGGADVCRAYLESVEFPPIEVREILPPEPWDYATDGIVTTFDDAIGVEVERLVDGQTIIQELHIVYEGPELRWFTDCGDPV